jgi:hypothetical protein
VKEMITASKTQVGDSTKAFNNMTTKKQQSDAISSTSHGTSISKEDEVIVPPVLLTHLNHDAESFANPVTEVSNLQPMQIDTTRMPDGLMVD